MASPTTSTPTWVEGHIPTSSSVNNYFIENSMSKPKVFGIATDTIRRNGEMVLKNGKRMYGAVGWYRIVNPLKKLGAEISIGYGIKATAEDAMKLKEKGDVWFCKMADNEGIDHLYGAHKEFTGAKFVLDLDDDIEHINLDHPDYDELEKRHDMRMRMVKMADHIVVSTEPIRDTIEKYNPYITVIPNSIDPKIWKVKRKKRKDGKIRIVWISSGSHFADMPLINPVIDDILEEYDNVEFHFAGMTWDEEKTEKYHHHIGTLGYKDFPQFFADLDPDICIAPLKDNQFNNCKSNIKWLEASMLGVPTVASDVIPYRSIDHGKTGYLSSTPGQMTKYLKWLIDDPVKRKKIGQAAKKEVLKNWTIEKFLPLYEDLFEKLTDEKDITVITAITGRKDKLKPQPEYKGVRYMAFTDKDIKDSQWIVKQACDKFVEPVMNAKIHKILAHKYCDTPYIMWIDGSVELKTDPHELIKVMGKKDMAFFKHHGRNCLYDEAEACVQLNKDDVSRIAAQVKEYAKLNFPEQVGLNEMTVFFRRNTCDVNTLFEAWWAEICRFSNRDQISFPMVFRGQEWATIPGDVNYMENSDIFTGNKYFKNNMHKTL